MQEEIRGVIDAYTDDVCLYQDNPCEYQGKSGLEVYCSSAEYSYKCLMKRLSELGVVIKVDGELPKYWFDRGVNGYTEQHYIPSGLRECMEEAGYVAVEPLKRKGR